VTQAKSKIGLEWKRFRQRRLFTQADLANALAISRRQVQNIEYGLQIPRFRTQARFNALKAKHQEEANGGADGGIADRW